MQHRLLRDLRVGEGAAGVGFAIDAAVVRAQLRRRAVKKERCKIDQLSLHFHGGVLHGAAEDKGRPAGEAAVVDGGIVGVRLLQPDALVRNRQHLCYDHPDHGNGTAAVILNADVRLHGPVLVHLQPCLSVIVVTGKVGVAVSAAANADPAAIALAAAVEGLALRKTLLPEEIGLALFQRLLQADVLKRQMGLFVDIARAERVDQPQVNAVDP